MSGTPRTIDSATMFAVVRVCVVVLAALPVQPALAAQPATMSTVEATSVDSLARAFRAEHRLPGLVVAVVRPDGDSILGYGVASLEDSTPVRADTRFEVGSVTKLFTALLLAVAAEKGELSLSDPIARYLPDSVSVPDFAGQPILLEQLATHSSGLPRLPTNLRPADTGDPYAGYDEAALLTFLDGFTLPRAPGTGYEYSNTGGGLLGYLLARRAGGGYADVLRQNVLAPLGLDDSYVPVGDSADSRMARGYDGTTPTSYWHFGVLAGAGELRSTAPDLARFLRAQLDPARTSLAAAIRASQQPRFTASPTLSMGLGWHVLTAGDGTRVNWHNGGTAGFRSFVAFSLERRVGVVALTNGAVPPETITSFGLGLLRAATS